MENASKALLIAGSVLIAILLLTLFSYLFTKMSEDSSRIVDAIEQNNKLEFNQQFLTYDKIQNRIFGYENNDQTKPVYGYLTAQDVATIINLAKDNNKKPKFPTIISVMYGGVDLAQTQDAEVWLKNKANSNKTYACQVHVNDDTALVDKINIWDL